MRDDEIQARLREVDPWWRATTTGGQREWAAHDRVLRDRARYDLGYRSNILDDVAHGPVDDKLVILRGPRRVGKSVAHSCSAALKFSRDNTSVGDDTVVCTGSSWSDTADVERDLLAGRAGSGTCRRTRLLLPMRFRDVLAATRPELPRPAPLVPWQLQSLEAKAVAEELEFTSDELDLAWQSYLTSGGFPGRSPNTSATAW